MTLKNTSDKGKNTEEMAQFEFKRENTFWYNVI